MHPRDIHNLEDLRYYLDGALALSRWTALAARRRDFAGADKRGSVFPGATQSPE